MNVVTADLHASDEDKWNMMGVIDGLVSSSISQTELWEVALEFLTKHHPDYIGVQNSALKYESQLFSSSSGVVMGAASHPLVADGNASSVYSCFCGGRQVEVDSTFTREAFIVATTIKEDNGCGHRIITSPRLKRASQKPASKKRRKRDARKQAA